MLVEKIGYDCSTTDKNIFEFDTGLSGNSNKGHEYGSELSESEKYDLIEFIKSLEQPEGPQRNIECS